jgi:hypothetical protein
LPIHAAGLSRPLGETYLNAAFRDEPSAVSKLEPRHPAHYREAQWRPCKLKPESLKAVDGWLEHYRHFWDEPLDRLEDYLRDIQAKGKKEKKNGNGKK